MISEKLIAVFLNLSVLSIVFSAEKFATVFLTLYVLSVDILVNTVLIKFPDFSLSFSLKIYWGGWGGWGETLCAHTNKMSLSTDSLCVEVASPCPHPPHAMISTDANRMGVKARRRKNQLLRRT